MSDRDAFRANRDDYADGMADGLADRDPQLDRLALGANRLNAYERGYIDSGKAVEDAE